MDVLGIGNIHTISTDVVTKFPLKVSIHDLDLLFVNIAKEVSKVFGEAFISSTILLIDCHVKTYVGLNIQLRDNL